MRLVQYVDIWIIYCVDCALQGHAWSVYVWSVYYTESTCVECATRKVHEHYMDSRCVEFVLHRQYMCGVRYTESTCVELSLIHI